MEETAWDRERILRDMTRMREEQKSERECAYADFKQTLEPASRKCETAHDLLLLNFKPQRTSSVLKHYNRVQDFSHANKEKTLLNLKRKAILGKKRFIEAQACDEKEIADLDKKRTELIRHLEIEEKMLNENQGDLQKLFSIAKESIAKLENQLSRSLDSIYSERRAILREREAILSNRSKVIAERVKSRRDVLRLQRKCDDIELIKKMENCSVSLPVVEQLKLNIKDADEYSKIISHPILEPKEIEQRLSSLFSKMLAGMLD